METHSPAFRAALRLTESFGPFSQNPKIDEAYRTLRLMGISPKEAKEMIEKEIETRLTTDSSEPPNQTGA